MKRTLFAAAAIVLALPAAAQSVPANNYTDMWWNPSESGWGISFQQHSSHQVFAVWYTYDPRDLTGSGKAKPLWFVMPGGSWTSPTRISGTVFVTNGVPFNQGGSNLRSTPVGTFTFDFSGSANGTFTYNVSAPSGLAASDPAYNLPPMSGSKPIQRQVF